MASELEAVQTKNIYDTAIKQINHIKVNLLKECYEYLGIDFGETKNEIVYHNYLADDPITINTNDGTYENGDNGSPFMLNSKFVDYQGPADGSIGSRAFPQGKGKSLNPRANYWPFYVFGFGASPAKRPDKAYSIRSAIECCKLAANTVLGYLNKGCKTIGDAICMYHTGTPTYKQFLRYYNSVSGINDIADGRFVSSTEMIQRQNYYQQHLVDYVHMSNQTPLTKSYKVLFPLITFISRQEQGVNCEMACKIALKEMGIS